MIKDILLLLAQVFNLAVGEKAVIAPFIVEDYDMVFLDVLCNYLLGIVVNRIASAQRQVASRDYAGPRKVVEQPVFFVCSLLSFAPWHSYQLLCPLLPGQRLQRPFGRVKTLMSLAEVGCWNG